MQQQNKLDINIGRKFPTTVNAIVEIPKDSSVKYEYNAEHDCFMLDRCLISSMRYPASYGFIPQTLSDDGDPLDILVYNTVPIQTGTLVECRIVGGLKTIDSGVLDYKILGIPLYNPNKYTDLNQIDEVFLKVTADFFTHYKNYNKKTNLVSVEKWHRKETIYELIRKKHTAYCDSKLRR